MHSRQRGKRVKKGDHRLAVFLLLLVVVVIGFLCIRKVADGVEVEEPTVAPQSTIEAGIESMPPPTVSPSQEVKASVTPTPTEEPTYYQNDPDNDLYPFNGVSVDWGAEVYAEGFRFYEIPEKYTRSGGCFPEIVQVYLWSLCEERGIDYYMIVALIERESGYRWDAAGDGGNSIGYMQIAKRWHGERMLEEDVEDLFDPYGNIRVGLNFFQYLNDKYLAKNGAHCVLMAYNMGETGAKGCWDTGIYSSEYSRGIMSRAEEIKQDLAQD